MFPVLLLSALLAAPPATGEPVPIASRFQGTWEGKLKVALIELRLVLHVGENEVTLDSVDQGATGLPTKSLSWDEEGRFRFELRDIPASFAGKLNEEGTEIQGHWKQGLLPWPLTFKKTDQPARLVRPQEPQPPFPYQAEDVAFENQAGGVRLAGTLTIPQGTGPFPAVVLISGSGPQDRDESILGHKPFLVLADALTRWGIAVLRFDDRGVGGSTGNTLGSTSEEIAGDVQAAIAFLKDRPEVSPRRIGLIGHSEGGLIAPMVAARSDDVAFLVLMAGTGLPGEDILIMQGKLILQALGRDEAAQKAHGQLQRKLLHVLKTEPDDEALVSKLRAVVTESLTAEERQELGAAGSLLDAQIQMMQSPWFRFFLTYDPRPTLSKVPCPVLALNGEHDLQVPPRENLAEIKKALQAGGNQQVTVQELPGLNHLFQTSPTGSPTEYARIEETIAPQVLRLIGDWIREQVGTREPSGCPGHF